MMKRILCFWIALGLMLGISAARPAGTARAAGANDNTWMEYDYRELTVGNPTPMEGKFFTSMWGGTTSDLDAQQLLHGYSLVKWDPELGRLRFDRSVVSGSVTLDDAEGNRTYILILQRDLRFSNGELIMAWDYAFGLLLAVNPIISDLGGEPVDGSWLVGYDDYMAKRRRGIEGVRVLGNYVLSLTVKAEALPYFFELSRLSLKPYPISEIAPGHSVSDDGRGAAITPTLEKEELRQSILDPQSGYMSHPKVVSGPYTLADFDGKTATFQRNNHYKGNEEGRKPLLEKLTFTQANQSRMIQDLGEGSLGLVNKVSRQDLIREGVELTKRRSRQYTAASYMRSGLSLIWFNENSPKAQELAVRRAAAYCLDRAAFTEKYVGEYGSPVDGYYGLGQWMYQLVEGSGEYNPPEDGLQTEEERQARLDQIKAVEELSLDGLTRYTLDTGRANEILDEAGWTLDMGGGKYVPGEGEIRYKIIGERLLRLRLTMAVPNSPELIRAIQEIFAPALAEAGIELLVEATDMKTVGDLYSGKGEGIDMVFLGQDFPEVFDPEVFRSDGDSEIAQAENELYELGREMLRTEPEDTAGFLAKWVRLQERISETLPLIPLYSNMYFDFYTCELHDYGIQTQASWAEAILKAYMGYPDKK